MPRFRVHRMKDAPREQFRWSAHVGGLAVVKPKDYESGIEVDAPTPYAAWKLLGEQSQPLHPGDLLEQIPEDPSAVSTTELRIAKYIGFEPAQWWVPEPQQPRPEAAPVATYTAEPAAQ